MAASDRRGENKPREASEETDCPLARIVLGRLATAMAWKSNGCRIQGRSVDEWIRLMDNAYNKIHEPEEIQITGGMMRAYFGLIQLKVNATHAWGKNQLLNQRYYPFEIRPTPNADLPAHLEAQAKYQFKLALMEKINQSGANINEIIAPGVDAVLPELAPVLEQMARVEKDRARDINHDIASAACKRHERIMRDQFVEGGWHKAYDKVLFDQTLKPFGAMAVQMGPVLTWKYNGNRMVRTYEQNGYEFRHIACEDAFHAPDATSAKDGAYFIERLKRNKQSMYALSKSPNAIEKHIRPVLDGMAGSHATGGVETDFNIQDEMGNPLDGQFLEDEEVVCFRMAGELCGSDLSHIPGISVDDDEIVSAVIEICDGKAIYASFRPYADNLRGYMSAKYNGEGSDAAGISVGMMLWDRQRRLNRLDFYSAANERMAHGPVIEQLTAAIQDGDSFSYVPFNVFQGVFSERGQRALQFHQATPLWLSLYQQFFQHLNLADHESGIPAFAAYGARTGAVPTLGQEVIQHQSASKGIQNWLSNNDDDIITPTVEFMYVNNLIYKKDRSIQADARIHAVGALGALDGDLQAAQLTPALPQILQGTQIPGPNGQPLVPPESAQAAINKFLGQFGLPVPDAGSTDVNQPNSNVNLNTNPGISLARPDGRSGTLPA